MGDKYKIHQYKLLLCKGLRLLSIFIKKKHLNMIIPNINNVLFIFFHLVVYIYSILKLRKKTIAQVRSGFINYPSRVAKSTLSNSKSGERGWDRAVKWNNRRLLTCSDPPWRRKLGDDWRHRTNKLGYVSVMRCWEPGIEVRKRGLN